MQYRVHKTRIHEIMTKEPKVISQGTLATTALNIMEIHKITALVVTNDKNHPVGVIHMHDILSAGVI